MTRNTENSEDYCVGILRSGWTHGDGRRQRLSDARRAVKARHAEELQQLKLRHATELRGLED